MHPKKLNNVVQLASQERSAYFIRKVADFEVLWGLSGDEGWASSELHGEIVMPIWPEESFAELCAVNGWSGLVPKKIELSVFLDKWISNELNQYKYFGVFPINGNDPIDVRCRLVRPEKLRYEILQELEQYK